MIESIFEKQWVVLRHQQAPLLREREQFLAHCQQQVTSSERQTASVPNESVSLQGFAPQV
jgi:hypothetical protein